MPTEGGAAPLVFGLDFGTDSVRGLLLDAMTGGTVAASVALYPRWAEGRYCDPGAQRYRQHPLDGIEAMTAVVRGCLEQAPSGAAARVAALSVDTTASTPCLVDAEGTPLSLTPGFEEDPDAMFVLWKDHTATAEAARINEVAAASEEDYLRGVGGIYSSEWALAKAAHILGKGGAVAAAARGFVEHCDYLPALLTGRALRDMRRSRCAAGHKALWSAAWRGLPPAGFLAEVEPRLAAMREGFGPETWTTDQAVGTLTTEWAETLGLPAEVVVGVGGVDAHVGAVGAQVTPGALARIIGTSTCDIMVAPGDVLGERTIPGICGQVDGSVLPGMVGLEAGQSAFGDLYAWFARLLTAPVMAVLEGEGSRAAATDGLDLRLIEHLAGEAAKRDPARLGVTALDWINGRRTPDADQSLKAAVSGLDMGTDAVDLFAALVEATCFGSRAILDRLRASGVRVDEVIALGGIARKSPFVMQTMADVMGMPIKVSAAEEACALGAGMFASVAAGIHPTISAAQGAMGQGWAEVYEPDEGRRTLYDLRYTERYEPLGRFERDRAERERP